FSRDWSSDVCSSDLRFSDTCGAEIPRWIRRKLEAYGDDTDSVRAFGLDVVTELCDRLLAQDAPGLHFYTLNQAGAVTTIWQRLEIGRASCRERVELP